MLFRKRTVHVLVGKKNYFTLLKATKPYRHLIMNKILTHDGVLAGELVCHVAALLMYDNPMSM